MKQMTALVAASIFIAAISSCKKNDDISSPPPQPQPLAGKVKTIALTGAGPAAIGTFEYYPDGRVYRQSNGADYKVEYGYTDGFAVENVFFNGVLNQSNQYLLDAEGKTKRQLYLDDNGVQSSNTTDYIYNADKRIHTATRKQNGVLKYTTYNWYSNGNCIKDSTANIDGSWVVSTYEYYTDKLATHENPGRGYYLFGPGNKNCKKKIVVTESNGLTKTTSYSVPEVDSKGRVIKETQSINGGSAYSFEYTYY